MRICLGIFIISGGNLFTQNAVMTSFYVPALRTFKEATSCFLIVNPRMQTCIFVCLCMLVYQVLTFEPTKFKAVEDRYVYMSKICRTLHQFVVPHVKTLYFIQL